MHLPGEDNTLVDAISRGSLSLHKRRVDSAMVVPVFNHWETSIDVFASSSNKQCPLFCSRGGSRSQVSQGQPSPGLGGEIPLHISSNSSNPSGHQKVHIRPDKVHISVSVVVVAHMVPHLAPVVLKQVLVH